MSINMNEVTPYLLYLLTAIGVMAFVVSIITQVVKSWPGLNRIPTAAVVIILSLVLCPASFVALMSWRKEPIEWYMVFACMIAAFIVALVAMDGWERVKDIWDRAQYRKDQKGNRKNA